MKDPLGHIFAKRFVCYIILLSIFLLWPFDLFKSNRVSWAPGTNGIDFLYDGIVATRSPDLGLYEQLVIGNGLSIDIWLTSKKIQQYGPARIISYSLNTRRRNFTLGQHGEKLIMRLRTTETSLNGTNPNLTVDNVFIASKPLHIVITYDFIWQTVYVNGIKRAQEKIPGGNFSNWDSDYYLTFGNETTINRPWRGTIFRTDIYNRALSEKEVTEKFQIGWLVQNKPEKLSTVSSNGLVLRYLFEEQEGNLVLNNALSKNAGTLFIAKFLRKLGVVYLSWPHDTLKEKLRSLDVIFNVLGFIPFGFLMHGLLRNRLGLSWKICAISLTAGIIFSFAAESLQYFSIARHSSSLDLLANTTGTLMGILLDLSYARHVRYFWAKEFETK